MQGPSSSTSPDSAVCTGLWEVGMGCKAGGMGGRMWMLLAVLLEWVALMKRAKGTTHSRLANDISQSRPSGKTQWSQLVKSLQGCPVAPYTHLYTHTDTHTHE